MNGALQAASRIRYLALASLVVLIAPLGSCGGGSGGGSEISTFSKSYGGPADDAANAIAATADGGYVLVGQTGFERLLLNGVEGGELWLNKLDANGNVESARRIGLPANELPGTTTTRYARGRPTADGGFVLVGEAKFFDDRNGDGLLNTDEHLNTTDIAVTKLRSDGTVEWLRAHDSGDWRNYDYYEANGDKAAAQDVGSDVWPMDDGGFLVVGDSRANLHDRLGIGFPPGGPAGSDRFHDALSVVAMRLNADGSLRWTRRLADDFFVADNPYYLAATGPIIRGTSDGGAVLSRGLRVDDPDNDDTSDPGNSVTAVWRLGADGAPFWMRALDDPSFATDVEQTDDDADGARDDGFVLTADDPNFEAYIVKLSADGDVHWQAEIGDNFADLPDEVALGDVKQSCGALGGACVLRAVGSYEEDGVPQRAVVQVLDEQGSEIERVVAPLPLTFISRIGDAARGAP
ncbi:MAG: hypothetical protein ACRETY_01840, partial [Steroidobacteraceae bacterium]